MNELIEALSSPWAIRAMIASSLVGITCGLIGCFIVLRNMSLIGDALSHSILPGVYFAFLIAGYSTLGFFIGSVVAGIVTAISITWIQQNIKTKNDAAIGIVFTAMFSIGVMGISRLNNTQGNHLDLKDFLFGNIFGISSEDLILNLIVTLYTVISIIVFYRYFFISTFQPLIGETMGISTKTVHYFLMLMLSFAVVSALRTVGVILVVAMLITPASTALLLSHNLKKILAISAFLGMISSLIGLCLSIIFDTTPGPAMVIVATIIFLLTSLFAPEKGLVIIYYKKYVEQRKIIGEDILKYLYKNGDISSTSIAASLEIKESAVKRSLNQLVAQSLLMDDYQLTIKGKQRTEEIIRAHRLWETFQVDEMGLSTNQIHDDAERIEHIMSSDEVNEIESSLGYPNLDPHGSPIPKRKNISGKSLFNLSVKSKAQISENQPNNEIESFLWEMKIMPKSKFEVTNIDSEGIWIITMGKKINIPAEQAIQILVS
jgi:ABC-type Mn2+/Zn2+ transport system permease subunit/Mn-dependent DtxR family transcriptional regulator